MERTRKLSVVMFTDIVGYTRMMQTDESKGLKLGEYYRKTLRDTTSLYRGKVLKHFGDGSLIIFDSIIEAIRCARELQIIFQKDPAVPLRMGIHLGDLVLQKDDVYGDGVNIASRLESVGIPGSVIFSNRVKEELEHLAEIHYKSLGTFHLKNVSKPIEIFALDDPLLPVPSRKEILNSPKVIHHDNFISRIPKWGRYGLMFLLLGLSIWVWNKFGTIGQVQSVNNSIAVLPFVDFSQNGDQGWFCDGLTEQITSNLVRLSSLKVISRTSAMKFKGVNKTAAEIGKELNVSHILEGSVRKSEEKIRITAQLINVSDEYHLWEKDFDKQPRDFFEIQDEVSSAIADALYIKISDAKGPKSETVKFAIPTKNMEALRNYQLAKQYYDLYDSWASTDYQTSLNYFDAAIAADSTYADAYIGKADLLLAVAWRQQVDPEILRSDINYCIDKAIMNDPNSGLPFASKGYVHYLYDFNFVRAEELYKKAIELAPNSDVTYARYFWLKMSEGEFAEARNLAQNALELNPLNSGYYSLKAEAYWGEMKLDSAIALYQENLKLFPNDPYNLWGMACSYGWSGEYDKAIDIINSIPGYKDNNFATAYFAAVKGDTAYAREILDIALFKYKQNPNSWTWHIAAIYTALGEKETAMDLLEKNPIDFIYIAHWYKPLRSHPRFKKLIQDLGFNPASFPN